MYYLVNKSISKAGVVPQAENYPSSKFKYQEFLDWQYSDSGENPEFGPIVLERKANLTDLIGCVVFSLSRCMVVSGKSLDFFSSQSLAENVVFEVSLSKNDRIFSGYSLLKFTEFGTNHIDINKTHFYLRNSRTKETKTADFSIAQIESILNQEPKPYKHPWVLVSDKIILNSNCNLDLFPLSFLVFPFVVSEKFKKEMEKSDLDIFEFTPLDGKNGNPLVIKI